MKLQAMVGPYLEYCQYRKELDQKTLKAYRIDLRQFFEFVKNDKPDKIEIESYITGLHKQYKQKTVKRKIASIKAFYSYMEEEELLEAGNPFHKIKVRFKEAKILPRIIPRDAIEKLLNHMYVLEQKESREQDRNREKKINGGKPGGLLRDLAVVELFFATGARVCEISNLKKDCVDIKSGVIRIMGKGAKERYIQIGNQEVLELLERYYAANRKQIEACGYFFVNSRERRFTEQSMRNMIKKYTESAEIGLHITPHMFRHSFATYLIEEGVDISCVQKILGHSSIKTTQIYIHVASRKQAEILRTMHPRNKMKIIHAA